MNNFLSLLFLAAFASCYNVGLMQSLGMLGERNIEPEPAEKCPENQMLYPDKKSNDMVCDCKPGFVYYPRQDSCFRLYRRGPCRRGYYLVLKKKSFVPKCVVNPCKNGFAKYKKKCYELGKPNKACKRAKGEGAILEVNETTFKLGCLTEDELY